MVSLLFPSIYPKVDGKAQIFAECNTVLICVQILGFWTITILQ